MLMGGRRVRSSREGSHAGRARTLVDGQAVRRSCAGRRSDVTGLLSRSGARRYNSRQHEGDGASEGPSADRAAELAYEA